MNTDRQTSKQTHRHTDDQEDRQNVPQEEPPSGGNYVPNNRHENKSCLMTINNFCLLV